VYEIDNSAGVVRYDALDSPYQVDLPLDPMHGTVGVAPALGEVRSSLTPGAWGGNMDTPEMRAGTTCYLGVNVEVRLFSLGDGMRARARARPAGRGRVRDGHGHDARPGQRCRRRRRGRAWRTTPTS
jgi:hypothetical protein